MKWCIGVRFDFTHRTVPSPPRVITRSTFGCRSEISLSALTKSQLLMMSLQCCKLELWIQRPIWRLCIIISYHLPKFVRSRRNLILIKVLPWLVVPRKHSVLSDPSAIWKWKQNHQTMITSSWSNTFHLPTETQREWLKLDTDLTISTERTRTEVELGLVKIITFCGLLSHVSEIWKLESCLGGSVWIYTLIRSDCGIENKSNCE